MQNHPTRTLDEAARELLRERLTMHISLVLRTPIVQALVSMTFVVVNYGHVEPLLLYAMSGATTVAELLRSLVALSIRRRLDHLDLQRAHTLFVVMAAVIGGLNGATAIAFFDALPMLNQAYLLIIYFGMISAGIAHSPSSAAIHNSYSGAMLIAVNIGWARTYPEHAVAGLAFSAVVSVYAIFITHDSGRLLARSVAIRRERDRLLQDLQRRNDEVRDARQRAEGAAMSRARVLAAASHDLRQPMQALSMYSAMLNEKPGAGTLREVGQRIHQIVSALGSLLDGLLDLSRLNTGHFTSQRKVFRADSVLQAVCNEFAAQARARGLTLSSAMAPLRLDGDAPALTRVLRNLLDNAIKHTHAGSISVELAVNGACAVLSVRDTGIGIAESEQARIFEEFYQVDNPGRDRSKGVGLGLAIALRLCETMQAKLQVISTLGQGSRFVVTVPGVVDTTPQS